MVIFKEQELEVVVEPECDVLVVGQFEPSRSWRYFDTTNVIEKLENSLTSGVGINIDTIVTGKPIQNQHYPDPLLQCMCTNVQPHPQPLKVE